MESKQSPHQKLTEEEIKEIVCSMQVELHEFKESVIERLEEFSNDIYLLKRHFCPEKFQDVQVPLNFLSQCFEKEYENLNLSETRTFKKIETKDGMAETE